MSLPTANEMFDVADKSYESQKQAIEMGLLTCKSVEVIEQQIRGAAEAGEFKTVYFLPRFVPDNLNFKYLTVLKEKLEPFGYSCQISEKKEGSDYHHLLILWARRS